MSEEVVCVSKEGGCVSERGAWEERSDGDRIV